MADPDTSDTLEFLSFAAAGCKWNTNGILANPRLGLARNDRETGASWIIRAYQHDRRFPDFLERERAEAWYPLSTGKDRWLGQFPQLPVVDKSLQDVLLDVVVVVNDLRHPVSKPGKVLNVLDGAECSYALVKLDHSVTKRLRTASKLSVPKWRSLASFKYRSVCQ